MSIKLHLGNRQQKHYISHFASNPRSHVQRVHQATLWDTLRRRPVLVGARRNVHRLDAGGVRLLHGHKVCGLVHALRYSHSLKQWKHCPEMKPWRSGPGLGSLSYFRKSGAVR